MTLYKKEIEKQRQALKRAQKAADAKKQPQVPQTTKERIKANNIIRETKALTKAQNIKNISIALENSKNITDLVEVTSGADTHKITETQILLILNATILEGRNLLVSDSINLGDKLGVNHNSVKIISEWASKLAQPGTYNATLSTGSERYIRVMKSALKV